MGQPENVNIVKKDFLDFRGSQRRLEEEAEARNGDEGSLRLAVAGREIEKIFGRRPTVIITVVVLDQPFEFSSNFFFISVTYMIVKFQCLYISFIISFCNILSLFLSVGFFVPLFNDMQGCLLPVR